MKTKAKYAVLLTLLVGISRQAVMAMPMLSIGISGTLTQLANDSVNLSRADGLAFDHFGNLFATREVLGSNGGLTYVDIANGTTSKLLSLSGTDQVELLANGNLIVSTELSGASTTNRLYQVSIDYDANNIPLSVTANSITTSLGLDNPEGIAIIQSDNAYGNAGDFLISEDINPGSIFSHSLAGNTATSSLLTSGLARAEGLALGSFNGAIATSLFVTETDTNEISLISSTGAISLFGDPSSVNLTSPDNIMFGLDGYLYVSEDVNAGNGRIIRIDSQGNYSVFAEGFSEPQGMVIDQTTGDMYIAEQATHTIWRVSSANASVPAPTPLLLLISGTLIFGQFKRRTMQVKG